MTLLKIGRMRYTTSDGENLNARIMPEMKQTLANLSAPMLRKLKAMFPLPPKEDGTAARYDQSHFYNAILAYFLDAPREEQERIITVGWVRMLEVYGEETPEDLAWRKKPPLGGKGGEVEVGETTENGVTIAKRPQPPKAKRGG